MSRRRHRAGPAARTAAYRSYQEERHTEYEAGLDAASAAVAREQEARETHGRAAARLAVAAMLVAAAEDRGDRDRARRAQARLADLPGSDGPALRVAQRLLRDAPLRVRSARGAIIGVAYAILGGRADVFRIA
jgi:hypothetical protein